MYSISIDRLRSLGACQPECDGLAIIFNGNNVVFDMSYLSTLLSSGISVFWGAGLLSVEHRTELALAWYDRGIVLEPPSWRDAVRALVAIPDAVAATVQLGLRLEDRRSADPTNAIAVGLSGLGYAASSYAVKMVGQPSAVQIHASISLLATWAAQCVTLAEQLSKPTVMEQFQTDVWTKLVTNGPSVG